MDGVVAKLPADGGIASSTAQVASEAAARAAGDSSLGLRVDAVNVALGDKANVTAVNALTGRVDTIDGKVTAQGEVITSVTSTTNALGNERPNILPDPTFAVKGTWDSNYGGAWAVGYDASAAGSTQYWNGVPLDGRVVFCDSDFMPTYAGQSLTATVESRAEGVGGLFYIELLYYNASKVFIDAHSNSGYRSSPFNYAADNAFDIRKQYRCNRASPTGAAYIRMRVVWALGSGGGVATQISFCRPKIEVGSTPTPFNDQLSAVGNAAATVALGTRTSALEATSNATIGAISSIGGSGVNILPDEYTYWRLGQDVSASRLERVECTTSVDAASDAPSGYALRINTTTTNVGARVSAGPVVTVPQALNMPAAPGKYVVSFYAKCATAGHQIRANLKGPSNVSRNGAVFSLTTTLTRYSSVIDTSAETAPGLAAWFHVNISGVAGRTVYIDRVQIEPIQGNLSNNAPTPWVRGDQSQVVAASAQAVADLTSRVTPLESTAAATTAAIASLGGSNNLLENSDFLRLTGGVPAGWSWAWNPGGWTGPHYGIGGSDWEPSGGRSIGGTRPATPGTGDFGVVYGNRAQAVPGKRYIVSGFTAAHRCTTRLALRFLDKAGANLGEPATAWSNVFGQGGSSLANWEYRWLSAVAPTSSATVEAGVWVTGTGDANSGANPIFWFTRPMLEEASNSQTQPSPWAPGNNSQQNASAITTLTASINATAGTAKAINGVYLDVNGLVSGTVSENDGRRSSFSVLATVFRVISSISGMGMEWQDGYLRIWRGTAQLILGHSFGSGEMVMWYGPNLGPGGCTKANALFYLDTSGGGYFGGTVISGTISAGAQSSQIGDVTVETGSFNTNGRRRVVQYGMTYSAGYNMVGGTSGAIWATLTLQRKVGAGSWSSIDSLALSGVREVLGTDPELGSTMAMRMSGSSSYIDTSGGTENMEYRVVLGNRGDWPPAAGVGTQRTYLNSTEY